MLVQTIVRMLFVEMEYSIQINKYVMMETKLTATDVLPTAPTLLNSISAETGSLTRTGAKNVMMISRTRA